MNKPIFLDRTIPAFVVCTATLRDWKVSLLLAPTVKLLKKGSRARSVGTEDVNRERKELETAIPQCVIIHPEQRLYVPPLC
jgi:hypothetical protein